MLEDHGRHKSVSGGTVTITMEGGNGLKRGTSPPGLLRCKWTFSKEFPRKVLDEGEILVHRFSHGGTIGRKERTIKVTE